MGTTYDMALLPDGSDHHTFEMRFALSPIVKDGIFSQFPGIERVITPIKGNGLHLAFETSEVTVPLHQSHRFDTGLTPVGSLVNGPIEVVNVMARRSDWDILECGITDTIAMERLPGDLVFAFALTGDVPVRVGSEAVTLALHDAVIATGAGDVQLVRADHQQVLFAHLRRVAG